jgi:hypothetical protein
LLNGPRIDCKPPSNLIELIEKDLNFEEELKGFEGFYEWDELLDILNCKQILFDFLKIILNI